MMKTWTPSPAVTESPPRRCATCSEVGKAEDMLVRVEVRPRGAGTLTTWHCADREGCEARAEKGTR